MAIHRWDAERDGPVSETALRSRLEARGYVVSRYTYPPGTEFPDHTHGVDKVDAVLSGTFQIVLEGDEVVLSPGDAVEVPLGAVHRAAVVGDEPVVSLDAVSAARDVRAAVESSETRVRGVDAIRRASPNGRGESPESVSAESTREAAAFVRADFTDDLSHEF